MRPTYWFIYLGSDGIRMPASIIEVKGLTKKFGNFTAVDNISFTVKEGEVFAFLGPNGAGKTTTIKMLTTLLTPTAGSIRLNNFDIGSDKQGVRRSFGIVFQDQSLDDELTAYENMDIHGALYGVPKPERKQRIERLLKLIELWDRKDGIVKQFSGGMRRRLEIARALLHRPRIIFLDEPTVGLDPQTRNSIWSYIKNLSKTERVTVLFTTHYLEEADKTADGIAIIDHGKIVGQGTPAAVKKKTGAKTLEDAFLKLTGHRVRDDEDGGVTQFRQHARLWGRR